MAIFNKLFLLALLGLGVSACSISGFFQRQYYKNNYEAQKIESAAEAPKEQAFVSGVHCYSYENAYCQSASLQMAHSLQGEPLSIHHYNWYMGFISGAYYHEMVGMRSFLPSRDPELGFQQAAEHLGYDRKYLVSNDRAEFMASVKLYLGNGQPVRVAMNSPTMADVEGFYPHSILLVGYTKDKVSYYETGGENRSQVGYDGETVPWNTLLSAIESVAEGFNYKWTYQMTVFDFEGEQQLANPLDSALLAQNGESMVGAKYGPVHLGSAAFAGLGKSILETTPGPKTTEYLVTVLGFAVESRKDAAAFLEGLEPTKLRQVAASLRASSQEAANAIEALKAKKPDLAAQALEKMAANELAAGTELLALTKKTM